MRAHRLVDHAEHGDEPVHRFASWTADDIQARALAHYSNIYEHTHPGAYDAGHYLSCPVMQGLSRDSLMNLITASAEINGLVNVTEGEEPDRFAAPPPVFDVRVILAPGVDHRLMPPVP
jgi:hypothetical protein